MRKRAKGCVLRIKGLLMVLVFLTLAVNTAPLAPVYAHVLKTDGSIGIIMHIDPGDDPVANSQSILFFNIKDERGKFDLNKCSCQVNILKGGKNIFSTSLSQTVPYTFPGRDVYQVNVVGTPLNQGDFQPFNINFDVRVDKDVGTQPTTQGNSWLSSHLYLLIGVGVVITIFGFSFVKKPKRE